MFEEVQNSCELLPLPFLLLLNAAKESDAVLATNISVSPSSGWYFALSPFESILLGLVVLKLLILRYMKIIPVNLNDALNGNYTIPENRRRKREVERQRLADTMFTVIRRLDMQDCLLRSLCELQAHSNHGYKVPRETKMILSALSQSGWKRNQTAMENPISKDFIEERPILSVFEEAVMTGWDARTMNGTECQERYFICPLNKDDILSHFETIQVVNVL